MKILIFILIGLSAYMSGVVTAVLRERRKKGKGETRIGRGDFLPNGDPNLHQKNFLNYDGTIQS